MEGNRITENKKINKGLFLFFIFVKLQNLLQNNKFKSSLIFNYKILVLSPEILIFKKTKNEKITLYSCTCYLDMFL